MRRVLSLLALLAVPALVDVAAAGNYTPPPGDCCPQWSPHGTQIVFTTSRPKGATTVGAVSSAGGPEQLIPGIPVGARSPDWEHVAYTTQKGGATWLTVANVDGSGEQLLAQSSGDFAWSPDSNRLAFVAKDRSLDVIDVDGNGLVKVVPEPAAMPVWNPNETELAYVATAEYGGVGGVSASYVQANPPGYGYAALQGGPGTIEPAWSPDGNALSFLDARSIVVETFGFNSGYRSYVLPAPPLLNNGWFPDGKAILYDAEPTLPADMDSTEIGALVGGRLFQDELVRLDLKTGKRRILSFGTGAEFSHDGRSIAFSSGGECRDREGIYVMHVDGTQRKRLTNDCAIRGTPRADTLHGTRSPMSCSASAATTGCSRAIRAMSATRSTAARGTTCSSAASGRTRSTAGRATTRSPAGRQGTRSSAGRVATGSTARGAGTRSTRSTASATRSRAARTATASTARTSSTPTGSTPSTQTARSCTGADAGTWSARSVASTKSSAPSEIAPASTA